MPQLPTIPKPADLSELGNGTAKIQVAGRDHVIRKMSVADRIAIHERIKIQRTKLYKATEPAVVDMTIRERDAQSDMISRIQGQPVTQNDVDSEVNSTGGQLFIIWRCLKVAGQKMDFDTFCSIITEEEYQDALLVVGSLNGWGELEEAEENPTDAESMKSEESQKSSDSTASVSTTS